MYTKNFRKNRNQEVFYAPRRVKRDLAWKEVFELTKAAGVSASFEKKGTKAKLNLSVELPSGRTVDRHLFFAPGEDLEASAVKAARQALLGFEADRGLSPEFAPQAEAPDLDELADIQASFAKFDAAAGAILRAEITAA